MALNGCYLLAGRNKELAKCLVVFSTQAAMPAPAPLGCPEGAQQRPMAEVDACLVQQALPQPASSGSSAAPAPAHAHGQREAVRAEQQPIEVHILTPPKGLLPLRFLPVHSCVLPRLHVQQHACDQASVAGMVPSGGWPHRRACKWLVLASCRRLRMRRRQQQRPRRRLWQRVRRRQRQPGASRRAARAGRGLGLPSLRRPTAQRVSFVAFVREPSPPQHSERLCCRPRAAHACSMHAADDVTGQCAAMQLCWTSCCLWPGC